MTIYEKLGAIWKAVQYLQKDDHLKFGSTNYKALSEEKVTTTMRDQMIAQGLVVYPIEMTSSRTGQISHVDVKYRIVNIENPDEYIDVVSCGDGADTQDKGAGKAMTYAYKYMWLRVFGIPTGEDPDKVTSQQLDEEQAAEDQAKKAPAVCEECGETITATKNNDYDTIIRNGMHFNKHLCYSCLMKAFKAEKAAEAKKALTADAEAHSA